MGITGGTIRYQICTIPNGWYRYVEEGEEERPTMLWDAWRKGRMREHGIIPLGSDMSPKEGSYGMSLHEEAGAGGRHCIAP